MSGLEDGGPVNTRNCGLQQDRQRNNLRLKIQHHTEHTIHVHCIYMHIYIYTCTGFYLGIIKGGGGEMTQMSSQVQLNVICLIHRHSCSLLQSEGGVSNQGGGGGGGGKIPHLETP